MKKIAIALLLLAAAGGAVWFFGIRPTAETVHPAQLLPRETLVMIEAVDLKESLDAFHAGPLGKALAGIDLPACLQALNVDPQTAARILDVRKRVTEALGSLWFDALFGDLAAIAVLPPSPREKAEPAETVLPKSVLMLVRPRESAETIQWLGKMFAGDVAIRPAEADGIRMDRIETGDFPPFFVCVHRGLMMAALDPEPIVRCLAPAGEGRESLADSPDFALLCDELKSSAPVRSFVWIDLYRLSRQWEDAARRKAPDKAVTDPALRLWNGILDAKPVAAAVATEDDRLFHHRWRVRYNAADLSPEAARMLSAAPQINATLPWMPEGPLYYSWHNNLKPLLHHFIHLDEDRTRQLRQDFEAGTGMELEEFLDAFGDQFAILVRDVKTGGMFPVPELALLVEAGRPEVIDRLVDAAAREAALALETETFQDFRIRYLSLPAVQGISPAYAVRDGFVVLASSRSLLKTLLAPEAGGLAREPLFSDVEKGFSGPGNKVAYLRLDLAAARAREVAHWGLMLAMMTGKIKDPEQMTFLFDQVIVPVLNALSEYPAVGSRTISEENVLQADSYLMKPAKR